MTKKTSCVREKGSKLQQNITTDISAYNKILGFKRFCPYFLKKHDLVKRMRTYFDNALLRHTKRPNC